MIFSVNDYNLKDISIEISKSKGINYIEKENPKTYKKGEVINFKMVGYDDANRYDLKFSLLSPLSLLNEFKDNKLIKLDDFIDEEVIIGINNVLDSSGYKYCDFFIEKLEIDVFKLNVYIKNYEFLSPKYNMFIEMIINFNEI